MSRITVVYSISAFQPLGRFFGRRIFTTIGPIDTKFSLVVLLMLLYQFLGIEFSFLALIYFYSTLFGKKWQKCHFRTPLQTYLSLRKQIIRNPKKQSQEIVTNYVLIAMGQLSSPYIESSQRIFARNLSQISQFLRKIAQFWRPYWIFRVENVKKILCVKNDIYTPKIVPVSLILGKYHSLSSVLP